VGEARKQGSGFELELTARTKGARAIIAVVENLILGRSCNVLFSRRE
jgi:hypothetical protein